MFGGVGGGWAAGGSARGSGSADSVVGEAVMRFLAMDGGGGGGGAGTGGVGSESYWTGFSLWKSLGVVATGHSRPSLAGSMLR